MRVTVIQKIATSAECFIRVTAALELLAAFAEVSEGCLHTCCTDELQVACFVLIFTLDDGIGVAVVVLVLRIAPGVKQALDHCAVGIQD